LTGWQKYYHDAPLCELLPVGIPSLAVQLTVLKSGSSQYKAQVIQEATQKIGLGTMSINPLDLLSQAASSNGTFPGAKVFSLMAAIQLAIDNKEGNQLQKLSKEMSKSLIGILDYSDIQLVEYNIQRMMNQFK